jgi:sigma-B regulation protein RsbU (phosphoserine phosphatase)
MTVISARLRRRTESEVNRQALQRELAIGRKMQLSLLPLHVPDIPGWQFATHYQSAWQVGGDFYDFIRLDEEGQKMGLVIADVTGKGVPAALIMAMSRTLFRAESDKGQSAASIMQRVNEHILSDSRAPLFLSALYAILDLHLGSLCYSSAGHNPPLCLRAAEGLVEELPAPGYLLGAFRGVSFTQQQITLAEGDALILYTDGVSEARNAERQFLGEERLQKAILSAANGSAEEIKSAILSAVADFTGPVPQADDLTLLVAKRTV